MKTPRATILALLAVLPAASAFQQPVAIRYNSVVRIHALVRNDAW